MSERKQHPGAPRPTSRDSGVRRSASRRSSLARRSSSRHAALRRSAVALALALTVLVTAGCSYLNGSDSDDTKDKNGTPGASASAPRDTKAMFLEALDGLAALPALRFSTPDTERTITARGVEVGTATVEGERVPLLTIDGDTYFRPGPGQAAKLSHDIPDGALDGRWLMDTAGLTGASYAWAAPPALADVLRGAVRETKDFPARDAAGTRVGTTTAFQVTTPAGELFISKDSPHRVLRFTPSYSDGDSGGDGDSDGDGDGKAGRTGAPHLRIGGPRNGQAEEPDGPGELGDLEPDAVTGPELDKTYDDLVDKTKQLSHAVNPQLSLSGATTVQCSGAGCTATVQVTPKITGTDPSEVVATGPVQAEMTATFTIAGGPGGGCATTAELALDQAGSVSCSQPAAGATFAAAEARAKAQAEAGAAPGSYYRWEVPYQARTLVLAMVPFDVQAKVDQLEQDRENGRAPPKTSAPTKTPGQSPKGQQQPPVTGQAQPGTGQGQGQPGAGQGQGQGGQQGQGPGQGQGQPQTVPRQGGSLQGAEALQRRSVELNAALPRKGTVVTVVKVQKIGSNETQTWVATSNRTTQPELQKALRPGEVAKEGKGHAEQTIIDNLYENGVKRWQIVEGGVNLNVCRAHPTGQCALALEAEGIRVDGKQYPWRKEYKTDYRTFWFDAGP